MIKVLLGYCSITVLGKSVTQNDENDLSCVISYLFASGWNHWEKTSEEATPPKSYTKIRPFPGFSSFSVFPARWMLVKAVKLKSSSWQHRILTINKRWTIMRILVLISDRSVKSWLTCPCAAALLVAVSEAWESQTQSCSGLLEVTSLVLLELVIRIITSLLKRLLKQ